MKFAKYLETESVPEWKQKYIDYKALKKALRHIEEKQGPLDKNNAQSTDAMPVAPIFGIFFAETHKHPRTKTTNALSMGSYTLDMAETFARRSPEERSFFDLLDKELEKICQFYEEKEKEAVKRLYALREQVLVLEAAISGLEEVERRREEIAANEKELKQKLEKALLEFYRSVELLKNYKILNHTGFMKILKKFEKTTNWKCSKLYMHKAERRNFVASTVLDKIIAQTETLYTEIFDGDSRKKAMDSLRIPDLKKRVCGFVLVQVPKD
ncbi:SPX-domain-containing protein [Basidiobolus meristosporus CBS 931.73]|uniref:SPX-domain-containing protein n=1 Tax=Basidiobolus meristosporus CBS 931.73 TaxID=1314790 RepID=A0A1Y1ZEL2_9FUNG|nr:SPX-domain-containing protein [Basidiobolus meristosporus CBS 931.73]|eukprot:ORY08265.1 SPX-domain-containing protein [Basidiobolus meristosporus CBS 931.73]